MRNFIFVFLFVAVGFIVGFVSGMIYYQKYKTIKAAKLNLVQKETLSQYVHYGDTVFFRSTPIKSRYVLYKK